MPERASLGVPDRGWDSARSSENFCLPLKVANDAKIANVRVQVADALKGGETMHWD